jgi:N-acetylglucosaminyldiphosphoundecaprenol N-acetyl-beta-D-mannosaminyltransferase
MMATESWMTRWQRLAASLTLLPNGESYMHFLSQLPLLDHPTSLAFANAHAFNVAAKDADFFANLSDSNMILRDGIGVSLFCRMLSKEPGLNLNGTDLIPVLIDMFSSSRIAFYGTTLDTAMQAATAAQARGANDVVVLDGYQSPDVYLEHAQKHMPRLIVLAMGMPRQERLARQLRETLHYPALIVCGGAILDFIGGKVGRAPEFMRHNGMEWLYRLALEPQRLFKRYVMGNPLFLIRSLWLSLRKPRELRLSAPTPIAKMMPAASVQPVVMTERVAQGPLLQSHARPVPGFQASRPVTVLEELFGRKAELERLRTTLLDNHRHVMIYGQRGYGKTSLARVFGGLADDAGHAIFYVACERNLSFHKLIIQLVDEIVSALPANVELGRRREIWQESLSSIFEIAESLSSVKGGPIIFILDEYDRIGRDDTRESLIELIKNLSDISAEVKFLLVGVAHDAMKILGYHPSIHRCLTCMPLQRLMPESLTRYLADKSESLNLNLSHDAIRDVVHVCAGSTYHAQLIGQLLIARAKSEQDKSIDPVNLKDIFQEIVKDAVVMDPSLSALAERYQSNAAQAKQLTALTDMSLAHEDVIHGVKLSKGKTAVALRSLCEELLSEQVLEAAAVAADGKVRDYRFTNAFAPQILRMVHIIGRVQAYSAS